MESECFVPNEDNQKVFKTKVIRCVQTCTDAFLHRLDVDRKCDIFHLLWCNKQGDTLLRAVMEHKRLQTSTYGVLQELYVDRNCDVVRVRQDHTPGPHKSANRLGVVLDSHLLNVHPHRLAN
ncbi:hypothetical protein RF11_15448 [Thelohanellus kitauei]|uniref:Uncharacterized protein n=1 Tax=Thelohanellus kitauei TaxID=669202 RepID=A0A0C2IW57_THEKT|nr:hypothetical protein RF11_15448 [Thelohanellus kitauei]